jgi:hypothetical protein
MGLLIPLIYILAGAYILDISIPEIFSRLREWILLKKLIVADSYLISGIVIYLFIMFLGSIFALNKFAAAKIQSRKFYQLLFFLFINILLVLIIIPSAGIEILFLVAIPSSVLLSIYFTDCRNNFINRIFFLLLISIPILLTFFG